MTLGVQHTPSVLAEGTWDDIRETWADRVVDILCRYAPNMRDHIVDRHIITPLDLDRDYSIPGGCIFHTAMTIDQLFSSRPLAALSQYRTPIAGYYLCGAGMHPGGGVMGLPGHNAAKVVLRDLRGESVETRNVGSTTEAQKHFVDRILETPLGRRLGYKVARSRTMRPITERASRSRTK